MIGAAIPQHNRVVVTADKGEIADQKGSKDLADWYPADMGAFAG